MNKDDAIPAGVPIFMDPWAIANTVGTAGVLIFMPPWALVNTVPHQGTEGLYLTKVI